MNEHFKNITIVRPEPIAQKRDDLQHPPIKILKHILRIIQPIRWRKHTDMWPLGNFVTRVTGKKIIDARCTDGRWLSFPLPVYTVYFLQGPDHKRFNKDNIHPIMKQAAKPGTAAIDVGASCGQEVVTLSRAVGPEGVVYCFEPSVSFQALIRTAGLNELTNVVCVNAGCGNENGFIEGADKGLYFTGHREKYVKNGTGTPVVRIDDFLKFIGEKRPVSVIKSDTDGFEIEVIEGAQETIKRDRPQIIAEFEPHMNYSGLSEKAVLQRYLAMGFDIKRIQTAAIPVNENELDALVAGIRIHEDMIAHDIVLSLHARKT